MFAQRYIETFVSTFLNNNDTIDFDRHFITKPLMRATVYCYTVKTNSRMILEKDILLQRLLIDKESVRQLIVEADTRVTTDSDNIISAIGTNQQQEILHEY